MSGGLGVSVADLGHLDLALEAPSDSVVDTMGFTPVRLIIKICQRNGTSESVIAYFIYGITSNLND